MSNLLRNRYGMWGFTELGGILFGFTILGVFIFVIYAVVEYMPEPTIQELINDHPSFSKLDCELQRNYITYNSNTHNHLLRIYAELCL